MPAATVGNTIGSVFLGVVASSAMWGVTNNQVYFYYRGYPNDRPLHRYSVGVLWLCDTMHFILTVHAVFRYVIDSFHNPAAMDAITWSFKLQNAFSIAILLMVQSLYALRVWSLGSHQNKFLPILVVMVVAVGYAFGIALTVEVYRIPRFTTLHTAAWAIYGCLATATSIDVAITAGMCYYLGRSRSSFAATDSKIVALMHYVLASGLLTSACSLASLITYLALPTTLVFLGLEFLLTKLYVNSFLAMLNARAHIGARGDDTGSRSRSHTLSHTHSHSHLRPGAPPSALALSPDKPEHIPMSPLSARIARFPGVRQSLETLPEVPKAGYAWTKDAEARGGL